MRRKLMRRKLLLASLMLTLSTAAVAGGVSVMKEQTNVSFAVAETWQIEGLENKYLLGTMLEVPAAEVEVGGEIVDATATVTYPDGTVVAMESVPLNQAGVYTVTYRAVVDGIHCVEEKHFTVENKSYLVQKETSSIEYGTYTKHEANSTGLIVRLAQNDTLAFSHLIDVSALTGAEDIIELFITPDSRGAYDFSTLVITLTDAVDSSIYLQYRVRRWPSETAGRSSGYVDVAGNGQTPLGYEESYEQKYPSSLGYKTTGYGTPFTFTFSATRFVDSSGNNAWSGNVANYAPDASTCRLAYNPLTMEASVNGKFVSKLNNIDVYKMAWTGWPSGKARLTISADEINAETANFCITNVLGLDNLSSNTFAEKEGPMIDVAMSQEEMPNGQLGYEYAIPSATAFDYYSGKENVTVSVYRNYASDMPINVGVVNGKFKPTVAGWHTIVYTATDALGNASNEIRNVYISEDLGDIEITLPEDRETEALLGYWVNVSEAKYTGDCGLATLKITASLGDETYELTDGFLPEVAGEWKITYTVTDYIGRTETAEYTVTANAHDEYVVLDELVLPQIFVSDSEYVLPEFYVNNYSSGKAQRSLCDVVVSDKNGNKTYKAGDSFTPSVAENGDMVTISYQCGGEKILERKVPAVLVKGVGKIIAKNYLYGEGFSTSYQKSEDEWYSDGIAIIADENSAICGWTFATPQLTSDFSLLFEGIAERAKFEALSITLTDSLNPTEQINLTLRLKGSGTVITVGDNVLETSGATLATNKQYTVSYNNGKFGFAGYTVAVDKTVAGETFTGFSSNLAYVRVDMINAKKDASYILRSINEANLSRRNLEVFAPNIKILGDFSGNKSLNTVYEIFPAIANDAFAPNTELKLTMFAPDGSIMVDNNGVKLENVATDRSYFITLSSYGQYKAVYTAVEKDWVVSNPLELTQYILVVDETAPQAKFINATQTTAKVGDTITLPELVFKDNVTANENMRIVAGVFNPFGMQFIFEGDQNAIKCAYAGEYTFFVMVFDEQNNMTSVTHVVTVTEK